MWEGIGFPVKNWEISLEKLLQLCSRRLYLSGLQQQQTNKQTNKCVNKKPGRPRIISKSPKLRCKVHEVLLKYVLRDLSLAQFCYFVRRTYYSPTLEGRGRERVGELNFVKTTKYSLQGYRTLSPCLHRRTPSHIRPLQCAC